MSQSHQLSIAHSTTWNWSEDSDSECANICRCGVSYPRSRCFDIDQQRDADMMALPLKEHARYLQESIGIGPCFEGMKKAVTCSRYLPASE